MIVHGIVCPVCKEFIWSEYRHDFKAYPCGSVFVDGGQKDYIRLGPLKKGININDLKIIERDICLTPWGSWEVVYEEKSFKVKKIKISLGERLSYQKHFKREEFWKIIKGKAEIFIEGNKSFLEVNESIIIKKGVLHRIKNIGKEPLIFIEIQTGEDEYFEEDDIIRVEDDYGRVKGEQL